MTYTLHLADVHQLLAWFQTYQRDLPWRHTKNPYHIWISEIMLQQTRVEAVKQRYIEFIDTLPTIQDLAQVDDEKLMKLWEGMGYYSRARNLKKCAQVLVEQYHATMPRDIEALRSLPGIGPYTAGAIAAQAFGIPTPAVDGNVLRVLCRYWGIEDDTRDPKTGKKLYDALVAFYQANQDTALDVSSFTQALMELGALVCAPDKAPSCATCPLQDHCFAYMHACQDRIPYRSKLKNRAIEEYTVLVLEINGQLVLEKRPSSGLLAGLYTFPMLKGQLSVEQIHSYLASALRIEHPTITLIGPAKHVFTHKEWHMVGYHIQTTTTPDLKDTQLLTRNLEQYAIPSAHAVYKSFANALVLANTAD